jgi:Ca2+-binding RTX toxin-like protein
VLARAERREAKTGRKSDPLKIDTALAVVYQSVSPLHPGLNEHWSERRMRKLFVCVGFAAVAVSSVVVAVPSAGAAVTCFGAADSHTATSSFDPGTQVTTIKGTAGADVIVAPDGTNLIYGLGGDDKICGGNGKDHAIGGPGNDMIEGGNDDDNLWGGPANDLIRGGNGKDHVVGENGEDLLEGENGDDNVLGGSADDELFGGNGADKLDGDNGAPANGFGAADFCDGGSGPNVFVNCELP